MDERAPLIRSITADTAEEDFPELDCVESVKFDPAGDPECPLDWPWAYKWGVVSLLAFMSFTTYDQSTVIPGQC
jgi:hypothetical protein